MRRDAKAVRYLGVLVSSGHKDGISNASLCGLFPEWVIPIREAHHGRGCIYGLPYSHHSRVSVRLGLSSYEITLTTKS